ncbi:MAG: ATP-grasp domain-containing protein [Geminicoccaceae bacterium]
MPPADPVLIVGLSGRQLAQSAARAGYAPIVLDAFGDLDTRAAARAVVRVPLDRHWCFRRKALLTAVRSVADRSVPLVWSSGLDGAPGLLDRLADGREILGNAGPSVRRVKDPMVFADACRSLRMPHPETTRRAPAAPDGWLVKRRGGSGGMHVRPMRVRDGAAPRRYFQRLASGTPVSALVLGDGERATTLACSAQWADPVEYAPFRYAGAVAPVVVPALPAMAERLVAHFGLKGFVSVDALVDGAEVTVLEINPRPGAALDAYERAFGVELFGRHVAACRGRTIEPLPAAKCVAASLIVYAPARIVVPPHYRWPEWAADRGAGVVIPVGHPVCTVTAEAVDATAALTLVRSRAAAVLASLQSLEVVA